jgi:hypothetical protein
MICVKNIACDPECIYATMSNSEKLWEVRVRDPRAFGRATTGGVCGRRCSLQRATPKSAVPRLHPASLSLNLRTHILHLADVSYHRYVWYLAFRESLDSRSEPARFRPLRPRRTHPRR